MASSVKPTQNAKFPVCAMHCLPRPSSSLHGLGVPGKDDADFVKNATRWYETEKDTLVPNIGYHYNDGSSPLRDYDKYPDLYTTHASERQVLFEKKGIKGRRDHH